MRNCKWLQEEINRDLDRFYWREIEKMKTEMLYHIKILLAILTVFKGKQIVEHGLFSF